MGKREIIRAAKKHGITLKSVDYYWTSSPGESYPEWSIEFGPELDDEIREFATAKEVVAYIEDATTQPGGRTDEQ